MRARQFTKKLPQQLDEIKMAPGTLQKFAETHPIAKEITAGFELELCFRKISSSGGRGIQDASIERNTNIEDLQDLFSDYVSHRHRGWARMEDAYREAWDEKVYEELNNYDIEARARDQAMDAIDREEIDARARELAGEGEDPEDFLEQAEEQLVDERWEDYRDDAEEEILDEIRDNLDYDFSEWLYYNFDYLSEVVDRFDLEVYFDADDGAPFDVDAMEEAAFDLGEATGLNYRVSDSYHGVRRGDYIIIEPDSSIEAPGDHAAAEVVSPPLPLASALAVYRQTVLWAKKYGGYTNDSTGLHFNISSPNLDNFDYLKMALLLGDQYLLKTFEREYNSYCKSALKKIIRELNREEEIEQGKYVLRAQQILDALRKHTYELAKVIATNAMKNFSPDDGQWSTEKYISLNWKGSYMEVRSAGGYKIMEDPETAVNAIYRIVRVWASAVDPKLDREEYLKKLYKMTQSVTELRSDKDITVSQIIANYMSGDKNNVAELIKIYRSQLEKSQQRRQSDKLVGQSTSKLPQPSPQMSLNFNPPPNASN